jgi:hypothetical protein
MPQTYSGSDTYANPIDHDGYAYSTEDDDFGTCNRLKRRVVHYMTCNIIKFSHVDKSSIKLEGAATLFF